MGRFVRAKVRYIDPEWRHSPDPPRIGSGESRRATTSYRDVDIHDARLAVDDELSLDTSGFQLTTLESPALPADVAASRTADRAAYHEQVLVLGAERLTPSSSCGRTSQMLTQS